MNKPPAPALRRVRAAEAGPGPAGGEGGGRAWGEGGGARETLARVRASVCMSACGGLYTDRTPHYCAGTVCVWRSSNEGGRFLT